MLRNKLNIKHYTPSKPRYSNYQIIKLLCNWFQNMTCFARIKLVLVQIHLKYWYCNTPSLQLPLFPRRLCLNAPWPTETLLNTILICSSSVFLFCYYPIQPHTAIIGYTKPYTKPIQSNLLSSYIQIITLYWSNALPIKNLSL